MPTCPRCQLVLEEGVRYCPVDGMPITPPEGKGSEPQLAGPQSLPTAAIRRPGPSNTPAPAEGQTESSGHSLIGTIIDNRYRISAPLGEGGIGAVFLAEHIQIRRKVAVKVLHPEMAVNPEFQARFEREALAASKVSHPSCVQVLDYGTYAGRAYLVMELVQGKDLREQLQQGQMPLPLAVAITGQILGALSQIHSQGIVHRDLKPANIMICAPDQAGVQVKLLDFGLAKNLQPSEPGGSPLTQYGTVFGTPGYISPEQATATPADARSDIYSVGVILFEMVCGRTPYVSDDPIELIQAHISLPPPAPRRLRKQISPALETVIMRALHKSRKERFQTAEEFAEALAQVPEASGKAKEVSTPGVIAVDPRTPAPTSQASRLRAASRSLLGRPKLALAAIGGLALIATLLGLVLFSGEKRGAGLDNEALSQTAPSPPLPEPSDERTAAEAAAAAEPHADEASAAKESAPPEQDVRVQLPVSASARRAATYLGRGWIDAAVKQGLLATRKNRKDPYARLILGHAYYKKLWCSDAIKEYGRALALAPQLKNDRTLIAHSIGCLGRRSTSGKAGSLLVKKIGAPARPLLEEAARDHGSTDIRRRAAQLLKQLDGQDS